MKILVFISKLYGGGGERVAATLLNHLSAKHNVILAVFNNGKNHYTIDNKIDIIDLSKGKTFHPYQLNRIIKCWKTIKDTNPDLIISFIIELNRFVLLSNLFCKKKIIVSERTTIQRQQSIFHTFTRRILYKLATKVVLVSKEDYNYAKWLKNKVLIHNPLNYNIISDLQQREKAIVAISSQRRWHVKGFDLLIQAWAKIAQQNPNWKLQFVGTNDDDYISNIAKSNKIDSQVEFLGWSNEIDKVLQTKSIFVLSSRNEGFPNSLIEAMSQGCACLAFDCRTGPNEIITNGVSGLLARNGDVDDLAIKIQLLINDERLRQKLSAGAIYEVKRFDKDKIMRQWDDLINDVTLIPQKKKDNTEPKATSNQLSS